MINKLPMAAFRSLKRLLQITVTVLALIAVPVAGFAQEITGSVRGTVQTPAGTPAVGQVVTVTDTRTGSARTVTTNNSGAFNVRGLTIGGPYNIRITSNQYESYLVTDVYTNLSSATSFNIMLQDPDDAIEEIVVTSAMVEKAPMAIGPGTSFALEEINAMPTINRQIRDIVRMDPRVSIGRASGGNGYGISCLGGSGRSNSFTIDGVRSADGFGLNASGNSARNTFPIPYDTVASASVEFAPMDVQYGHFTGCNVNIVTKSGTNEFHGSAVYMFNDDGLTGDTLQGQTVISEPFEDTNWALEVGGPIIKDKLFFYAAYEETDEGGTQNNGPIGAGFANEGDLTLAEAEQIDGILRTQYGRDTLGIVRTLPRFSERLFGRLDWNINNNHRAEVTYVKLEESNLEEDDFGFGGFTFGDNFEVEGTEQEAISVRLFSNWTDNFSTELRISTLDVQDIQGPQGGGEAQDNNIPRIEVQDGAGTTILTSGPGFFRSANDLQYTLDQFKLSGDYVIGDHTLTAGYELDSLEVFNLFIPDATGTIRFNTIADLQTGLASRIQGNGSFTGNASDAAASFARDIHTVYLQDEWQATDALTVIVGLRYDSYSSDDRPIENAVWEERYGFKNTNSFDGLDIALPRLGLIYEMPYDKWGDTQISAGFGIFTGGDPTVHFANTFQNFGGAIGFGTAAAAPCVAADMQVLAPGGGFTGIPTCIGDQQRAQAAQNTGRADAVDPNFKLPSAARWSFGISHMTDFENAFLSDWNVKFDFIYSDIKNAAEFLDLTLTPEATLPDGRPRFFAVDPRLAGCNATFNGPGQGFSNAGVIGGPCDAGRDDQDILLTNGISGSTTSVSIQLQKAFDFSARTSMDFRVAYALTDSKVGNPINSSTATSGFEEVATAVLNNNQLGPSLYANKHNFVLTTRFQHFFMESNPTSVSVFLRRRSGRPFSFVYDNNTPTSVFGDSDNEERNLFYVPTGANDPLVDFTQLDAQGTTQDFLDFLQRSGLNQYAGSIIPKNAFNEPWTTDMDVRIQQDIPTPWDGHTLQLFLDFENILNMFSDSNNIQRFASKGDVQEGVPVMDAALSADGSQFIYSNFNPGGRGTGAPFFDPINQRDVDDSVWRVQFGIRYAF